MAEILFYLGKVILGIFIMAGGFTLIASSTDRKTVFFGAAEFIAGFIVCFLGLATIVFGSINIFQLLESFSR